MEQDAVLNDDHIPILRHAVGPAVKRAFGRLNGRIGGQTVASHSTLGPATWTSAAPDVPLGGRS
jgi:hypothetical protein